MFAEREVRALRLDTVVSGISVRLVIGSAYAGIAKGVPLTPRPSNTHPASPWCVTAPGGSPVCPGVPSTGSPSGWPPNSLPHTACPSACYEQLPGDSLNVPLAPVYVTRNRYRWSNASGGQSSSYTTVSIGGLFTVYVGDRLIDQNSGGSQYSDRSLDVYVSGPSGVAAQTSVRRYRYAEDFGNDRFLNDDSEAEQEIFLGPMGRVFLRGSYEDWAALWGGWLSRGREAEAAVGYCPPLGACTTIRLAPGYWNDGTGAMLSIGGNIGAVPVGPVWVPIPVDPGA